MTVHHLYEMKKKKKKKKIIFISIMMIVIFIYIKKISSIPLFLKNNDNNKK